MRTWVAMLARSVAGRHSGFLLHVGLKATDAIGSPRGSLMRGGTRVL